jgi:hypothetical protein
MRGKAGGEGQACTRAAGRATAASPAAISKSCIAPISTRYSPHYSITKEEIAWLMECIAELHAFVRTVCLERLEGGRA